MSLADSGGRNLSELSESAIQKQILDLLKRRRIFHYRNNTGGAKLKGHYVHFGRIGAPDVICVINGKYVGIEVKNTKGELSRKQVEFRAELEKAGGIYLLVRSAMELDQELIRRFL